MYRNYFKKGWLKLFLMVAMLSMFLIIGCASDGSDGKDGANGADVDSTVVDDLQDQIDALGAADIDAESCSVCHAEIGESAHQEIYDEYADTSGFTLTVDNVASTANGDGTYTTTITFTILKDGLAYQDANGLPALDQKRFYAVTYDSTTRMFNNSKSFSNPVAVNLANGQYAVTSTSITFAPELSNAEVYLYVADGALETEGMTLYADVANAGKAYGDLNATTYVSAANVAGCEKCHGAPYMKHGYRAAAVSGLPDFAACKTCHYDTRNGGHEDWQILVDDPERFAEVHAGSALTAAEEAQYAYTANVMNDVHMSHAMEFPYPQSMSNCATCHDGKLTSILTDAFFVASTCKSCHPVTGPADGTDPHRAPAIQTLWDDADVASFHKITLECKACHYAGNTIGAETFSQKHTGYDTIIYADASGTKYSDVFTVTIDSASLSGNTLTINFSATESPDIAGLAVTDIAPTVMVGLYGYNTKDFIVGPHGRSFDSNADGVIDRNDERDLEYEVGSSHSRMTTVTAAGGSWTVTADLTAWADKISDGSVKRAEIGIMPELEKDSETLALNAPSRTFDLVKNTFDDTYYSDIINIEGCNACHDALATTFHSGNRGGNITICRMCHVTSSGGSHMEMQSRSIDSYAHAVHSFQAFDSGDVDFTDPVESVMYELHIEHVFPNFTIKNCEACHNEAMFEVPDQSKSLPGILSAADTWTTKDRNIGAVPSYVTGPASRACGSCHRTHFINEDKAGELAALNQHTKTGGYLIEVDSSTDDSVLETVIETIMALFD